MLFHLSEDSISRLSGHHEMRDAFRSSMTREQSRAALAFSVISPRTINREAAVMRGEEPVDKIPSLRTRARRQEDVRNLQQALLECPTLDEVDGAPDSVTVYRGLWHHSEARRGRPEAALLAIRDKLPVGSTLEDGIQHRFNSWSLLPSVALGFTRRPRHSNLVLRLRGHHMCNYYGSHNLMYREADFIMPLGTHLRVVDHSIQTLPRRAGDGGGTSRAILVDVEWDGDPWSRI